MKKQLEERTRELAEARGHLSEALEQQAATSEVLQVISSSPGELEPVFQAMLANATRLCEAKFGNLYLHERGALRVVASHNVPRAFAEARRRGPIRPAPGSAFGKLIRTKQTVEIADVAATRPYAERDPAVVDAVELGGVRTGVVVPMLKNNDLVGAIAIFRAAIALVALDGMTHSPGRRPAGPLSEKSSPTALGPAGRTPRPVNSEHVAAPVAQQRHSYHAMVSATRRLLRELFARRPSGRSGPC